MNAKDAYKKQIRLQKIATALIVVFFLLVALTLCSNKDNKSNESKDVAVSTEKKEEKKEETYEERSARYRENFINTYNANCSTPPLVFVEEYELQNEDSGHYRVEYRLPAYEGKTGTFCTIGDSATMEILGSRVYIEGDTPTVAQASLDILRLFYPDISEESLTELAETMSDPEEMGFTNQHMPSISGNYYFEMHPNTSSVFIDGYIPLDD